LKASCGLKFLLIQAAVTRESWKKPFLAFFGPDVEKRGFRLPTFLSLNMIENAGPCLACSGNVSANVSRREAGSHGG
jgi:hypothetical protein